MKTKLTKEQAVIISGFTGILCGEFSDLHADVEKRLGRGVQTFEFGIKEFIAEVKKIYEDDFIEIATIDSKKNRVDFALVPKEMPKSFDEGLYVYSNSISIVDECSEGFIPMSDINHAEVWKLVIEAQEQNQ